MNTDSDKLNLLDRIKSALSRIANVLDTMLTFIVTQGVVFTSVFTLATIVLYRQIHSDECWRDIFDWSMLTATPIALGLTALMHQSKGYRS